MNTQDVTLPLPETLYLRLKQTAQATQQSLTDVLLHAVQVGSPPSWEDAPVAFQAALAALDRLDDEALWRTARSHRTEVVRGAHPTSSSRLRRRCSLRGFSCCLFCVAH